MKSTLILLTLGGIVLIVAFTGIVAFIVGTILPLAVVGGLGYGAGRIHGHSRRREITGG